MWGGASNIRIICFWNDAEREREDVIGLGR